MGCTKGWQTLPSQDCLSHYLSVVCCSVTSKRYYYCIKTNKQNPNNTTTTKQSKRSTRNKCFMWCITVPAFPYLHGISWISPGHPFCLLLIGSVEAQGRWQVRVDWVSKSSPLLVCWIFLAFIRLIAISFALTYWVRRAVCHLNKIKTQLQSNKKPHDLIQKAIKVI